MTKLLPKKSLLFLKSARLIKYKFWYLSLGSLIFFLWSYPALAQNINFIDYESNALKTFWLILSGILVFSMNAGFAMLEAGTCSSKNFTNILAKNLVVFCIASLAFWSFGFSLMFSDSSSSITGGIKGFFFYIPFF